MSMSYTNCPTCGASCGYHSENWKKAGVVSHLEKLELREELGYLAQAYAKLLIALESNLGIDDMEPEDLMTLYYSAVAKKARMGGYSYNFNLAPSYKTKIWKSVHDIVREYLEGENAPKT